MATFPKDSTSSRPPHKRHFSNSSRTTITTTTTTTMTRSSREYGALSTPEHSPSTSTRRSKVITSLSVDFFNRLMFIAVCNN
uniref:Uncharacterized protein n=1 Tax=Moniliophthora roreri TaxID=221103 RepID=A0A0W0EW59_MONRR